jgi:hypothetical protein
MISDQGQALERHNLFVDSNNRKTVKVKVAQKYLSHNSATNKPTHHSLLAAKTVQNLKLSFYW